MDFLSLVGSGGLAGADSPYWFVGYDYFLELLGGEVEETILNLTAYHFELFAGLTLIEYLAAADDGADFVLEQLVDLAGHDGVGLAIVGAALAVSHDAVVDAHRAKHRGADLAGVGTFVVVVDILSANHEVGVVAVVGAELKVGERGADDHHGVLGELVFLELGHDVVY